MYCKNCGSELTESDIFCPNCGSENIGSDSLEINDNTYRQNQYSGDCYNSYNSQNDDEVYIRANDKINSSGDYAVTYGQNNEPINGYREKRSMILIIVLAIITVILCITVATVVIVKFVPGKDDDEKAVNYSYLDDGDEDITTDTEVSVSESVGQETTEGYENLKTQPSKDGTGEDLYVTAGPGLIMRDGAGKDFEKIVTLKYGGRVRYDGANDDFSWYLVYSYTEDIFGWVSSQYLSKTMSNSNEDKNKTAPAGSYYYNGYLCDSISPYDSYVIPDVGLILRSGPGTGYGKVVTLKQYTDLTVYGKYSKNYTWVQVKAYQNGRSYDGFVHGDYIW